VTTLHEQLDHPPYHEEYEGQDTMSPIESIFPASNRGSVFRKKITVFGNSKSAHKRKN
jgi:hypothetical protein